MKAPNFLATARPFREARDRYLAELEQVREDIERCNAVIAAPAPAADASSALDIERAKLLDDIHGTSTAAPLIAADLAAQAALADAKQAAADAKAKLPALQARAELLDELAAESRRLELVALSDMAGKAMSTAEGEYREAAEALVDKLATLMAMRAVRGASHRHKVNSDVYGDTGQLGLSPFLLPGGAKQVTLPGLEVFVDDLYPYRSGHVYRGEAHVKGELLRRAEAQLQAFIGDPQ